MKRLAEKNINTPEWFNHVWTLEGIHRYDAVRLRALLDGMDETKHLLDVGAGLNGAAQYAVQRGYPGRYTALDFSEEARRRTLEITPTLDYRIGDALAMPFTDATFDVVSCGELIEHFPSPEPLIKELFRVCKPGGVVLISTLDAHCDAAQVHTYPEHMVAWDSPEDLAQHFEPHGPTRAWVLGHYFMVECRKDSKDHAAHYDR